MKTQTIATILMKLKMRDPGLLKEVEVRRRNRVGTRFGLPVHEDFSPDSARLASRVLAEIRDGEEAKSFFDQWVDPRLEHDTRRKRSARERLRGIARSSTRREEQRQEATGLGGKERAGEYGKAEGTHDAPQILPTSLGRKIACKRGNWVWKRHWYRARAEQAIMTYLAESSRMKPTWRVLSYPDEWNVDDDIESLDLETSLDEGPIIPEVTTVKWHEQLMGYGQGPISGYVPSVLVLLDTSQSMTRSFDDASTAAYIAFLSGTWAGGETACINFSTDYHVAGWSLDSEAKEESLATHLGGLTIMPMPEVLDLLRKSDVACFLVIITDCGWQNIREILPAIREIGAQGHTVAVFRLKGWEYPEEVKLLQAHPRVVFHEVLVPESDLQGLVLAQVMGSYERYLR